MKESMNCLNTMYVLLFVIKSKAMKKIFIFIYCFVFLFHISIQARDMKILSFSQDMTNLSASTNPRKDLNGAFCSLIKVQIPLEGVTFEGNIIGEVEESISEYIVYIAAGSEFLVINHEKFAPLEIDFSLFGYPKLDTKRSYLLRISALEDSYGYNQIYEEQYTGINNGHKYVDLGLSVLWSITDLGAEIPESHGIMYAWGDSKKKTEYKWINYKFCRVGVSDPLLSNKDGQDFLKYKGETNDGLSKLLFEDDVARSIWGGLWRIPTKDEWYELLSKCTIYGSYYNGQDGCIVTGPNGTSIFLPVSHYWSSSLPETYSAPLWAIDADVTNDNIRLGITERCIGLPIRPVISK